MTQMAPNYKGGATPFSLSLLPRPTQRSRPNYKSERERLDSFVGFPCGFLDIRELAATGFWYTKFDDFVCCAFCGVHVGMWEEGDKPMDEHKKWSKNCKFLNHLEVGNIPVDPCNPPLLPPLEDFGPDECGIYKIKKTDNCPIILSLEKLGIHKIYPPSHAMFTSLESRLESFNNKWPIGLKLRPQELAEAGFFFTGLGDQTICFHCGGGLKDWAATYEPWREHALHFSKCGFVVQTKGREFIAEVLGKRPTTLTPEEVKAFAIPEEFTSVIQLHTPSKSFGDSSSEAPEASSSTPVTVKDSPTDLLPIDDLPLCKICFAEERGVVFLPCGHLVACVNCVSSLSVCAICRKEVLATVRVFLS